MSDKEKVLLRHPHAVSDLIDPLCETDRPAPQAGGCFVILINPDLGAQELGFGNTEEEAWRNAAERLNAP
jgi:hypothetical protein